MTAFGGKADTRDVALPERSDDCRFYQGRRLPRVIMVHVQHVPICRKLYRCVNRVAGSFNAKFFGGTAVFVETRTGHFRDTPTRHQVSLKLSH